ncbi:MAG: cytochrome, partial [Acidobacteria bacterium]|nr:cytochrome [Acidobacteriota bacterium]
ALALLLFSTAATAADAPEAVVKYRQSVMRALGAHMSAVSLVVKKKVSNRSQLAAHAEAIRALAGGIPDLFPAGTGPDKVQTDAKPELWQHLGELKHDSSALELESAKLVVAARRGEVKAFDAQYERVGQACAECHNAYRVKDQG